MQTLYFYDLETSSISPRSGRIMQFAGQRTDMTGQLIGEPHNLLIKLSNDCLPEPDAIMVTHITPQQTWADGVTEAEFLKIFYEQIATPGTIFLGYNSVRFDDEFMRFLHWRNFYDAYEWQWSQERSRWDLLDVVRMTRALRPDGIEWPVDDKGTPTVKLELLTKLNGLDHQKAHDALNDVLACVALAKLLIEKQPKLFDYLLKARAKSVVAGLVQSAAPFVYTSGKYANEHLKTTVVCKVADHPRGNGVLVFDLRVDPRPFFDLSAEELADKWQPAEWSADTPRFPVKTLLFNRCPAVAPLSVLDSASQERINLDLDTVKAHHAALVAAPKHFQERLCAALQLLDSRQQKRFEKERVLQDPSEALYDGFVHDQDKSKMSVVRAAGADTIHSLGLTFTDQRLTELFPLYVMRNYPSAATDEQRGIWQQYVQRQLLDGGEKSRMHRFFTRLSELASGDLTAEQQFVLEELQLYAQAIMPEPLDTDSA